MISGLTRIVWGETACARRHCQAAAAMLLEGEPYCLDHADAAVERLVALELEPGLAASLPPLEEA